MLDDGELRLVEHLEEGLVLQIEVGPAGEVELFLDLHAEGLETVQLNRQPETQAAEVARQLRGQIGEVGRLLAGADVLQVTGPDRKSTRLNSSHSQISYAVFCLKKKYTYAPLETIYGHP